MLSVVCPVYNEAENIEPLMDRLQSSTSIPMEVLFVYDSEDDNTIQAVKAISNRLPFEIKLVKNKMGVGALNAIKTGFEESRGEAVLVIMADLSDDFSVVDRMYHLVTSEGFDIVCASRYMPGGKHVRGPILKKFFSRAIGISLHYLMGLPTHDVTNSFKMYNPGFLKGVSIESSGGFEIGMELVVKAFVNGSKITEVPATWSDRTAGKSRFRIWRWAPNYFYWYLYTLRKLWRRKQKQA